MRTKRHGRSDSRRGRARARRAPGRASGSRRRPWACRPFAEERPADADDRGALLDRDLEVVAHPHRQLGPQAPVRRRAAGRARSREAPERRPRLLRGRPEPPDRSSGRAPRGSAAPAAPAAPRASRLAARTPPSPGRRRRSPGGGSAAGGPAGPPPAIRSRRRARSAESTASMTSKISTARRALFAWSGPTRCQRGARERAGTLAAASWTRFSPSTSRPAATAARSRSAGTVLLTATSVTLAGSLPGPRAGAAIRASTAARARGEPGDLGRVRRSGDGPASTGPRYLLRRRKLGISRSSAS